MYVKGLRIHLRKLYERFIWLNNSPTILGLPDASLNKFQYQVSGFFDGDLLRSCLFRGVY